MTERLDVVQLTDASGTVVAYASGSAGETSALSSLVWTVVGDTQDTELEVLRAAALRRTTKARADAEAGGAVLVDGNQFATDLRSVAHLLGHLAFALRDPEYVALASTRAGAYAELDANGVYAASVSIAAFMRACADWEDEKRVEIVSASTSDEIRAVDLDTAPDFSSGVPAEALAGLPESIASTTITCQKLAVHDIDATGTARIEGDVSTGDLTSKAAVVTSLDAGSGTIRTTGAMEAGSADVSGEFASDSVRAGSLHVSGSSTLTVVSISGDTDASGSLSVAGPTTLNSLIAGTTELGEASVASLDAGSGSIATTGKLRSGDATVTAIDAGQGIIKTTGPLTSGAAIVTSLDAGQGVIKTTGPLTSGATKVASLDAGAGAIATTGPLTSGAANVTALNAGAGAITTTGALTSGAAKVTSLNAGGRRSCDFRAPDKRRCQSHGVGCRNRYNRDYGQSQRWRNDTGHHRHQGTDSIVDCDHWDSQWRDNSTWPDKRR